MAHLRSLGFVHRLGNWKWARFGVCRCVFVCVWFQAQLSVQEWMVTSKWKNWSPIRLQIEKLASRKWKRAFYKAFTASASKRAYISIATTDDGGNCTVEREFCSTNKCDCFELWLVLGTLVQIGTVFLETLAYKQRKSCWNMYMLKLGYV